MRHRVTLRDVAVVGGVILLFGFIAYQYDFTSSFAPGGRIEIQEVLFLGGLVIIPIVYLGWRRIKDLESEINRRIAAERRAHEVAHTDPLTGLANRQEFEFMLRGAVALPCGPSEAHAVLMLDPTGFKKINELYGHGEGDDLLVAIAERVRSITRGYDVIARIGPDEFAVIAYHLSGSEGAAALARRIMKTLEPPIQIGSRKHTITVAIGIAMMPRDGVIAEDVMRRADFALARAKKEPQSTVCFFGDDFGRLLRERDTIARELALAIGTDELRPCYQPIVDLKTGEIVAFEALARWQSFPLGAIPPDRFIPIAESTGLIQELSDWLLRCAAKDSLRWPERVMLSFNIAPTQVHDRTLGLRIMNILGECGLSPQRLAVEFTESAIVRDLEAAKETLSSLREAGIRIAIDDFGTGYSSLYHLRKFKPDIIKIDRSLVQAMSSGAEGNAVVKAIAGLGNGLGITVVAKGIESNGERDGLLHDGCQQGQGFLFSRAVPADEAAAFFTPERDGRPTAIRI